MTILSADPSDHYSKETSSGFILLLLDKSLNTFFKTPCGLISKAPLPFSSLFLFLFTNLNQWVPSSSYLNFYRQERFSRKKNLYLGFSPSLPIVRQAFPEVEFQPKAVAMVRVLPPSDFTRPQVFLRRVAFFSFFLGDFCLTWFDPENLVTPEMLEIHWLVSWVRQQYT
jgi:hypothetical protein